MIKIGARQNYKTARLLRRLSTSNDHARPRPILDSRRVVRSPRRNSEFRLSRLADRPRRFIGRVPNKHSTHFGNRPPASKSP